VSENRVLRRIFGPKRNEVTGEWIQLHEKERNYLYSSPTFVQVIKSRIMRWAEHVARMGWEEACTLFWLENLRERGQWGDTGMNRPSCFLKCNCVKSEVKQMGWRVPDAHG
jgi:hypothetical protein